MITWLALLERLINQIALFLTLVGRDPPQGGGYVWPHHPTFKPWADSMTGMTPGVGCGIMSNILSNMINEPVAGLCEICFNLPLIEAAEPV